MNKTRFVHTSPVDTLASILVASSFVAIWLLWPASKGVHGGGATTSEGTRFSFRSIPAADVSAPAPLSRPILGSGKIGREDFDVDEVLVLGRIDLSKLLGQPADSGKPAAELEPPGMLQARRIQAYLDSPVFQPVLRMGPTRVRVVVSDALRARKFDASAISAPPLPAREEPWVLKAFVEVDELGTVTQTRLDTPTADSELNSAALRALNGSRAGPGNRPCDGTVTMSWSGTETMNR
ncbi:MAG: hypothetical protein WCL44_03065 [bacterium]